MAACMSDIDPSTENYDKNDAEIQTYISRVDSLKGGTLSTTGLYTKIRTANPAGKKAAVGEEVEFTYRSTNMMTGGLVDSTVRGFPVYYPLGIGSILTGLEEGVSLLREGERATLLIPSYLGYNDETKTNLPAYSVVRFDVTLNRSRSEDQQIDEYVTARKLTNVEKTASGLRFIKTQDNPAGATPTANQTVSIRYAGRQLRSATAFDSTSGVGTRDFAVGQLVKGFDEALAKLKTGEKATVIFPSSLGYGQTGVVQDRRYLITPYAPLRFDIELVSIK